MILFQLEGLCIDLHHHLLDLCSYWSKETENPFSLHLAQHCLFTTTIVFWF